MKTNYVDLFLKNYNKIIQQIDIPKNKLSAKLNALFATTKNQEIDVNNINTCRDIIKSSAPEGSPFRGSNLLLASVDLSLRNKHNENFEYMLNAYNSLCEAFPNNTLLDFCSQILCYYKDFLPLNKGITAMHFIRQHIKDHNWFSSDVKDISMPLFICATHEEYKKSFKEIEDCYTSLKNKNFLPEENLYVICQLLSFSDKQVEDRCNKIIELNEILINNNIHLEKSSLTMLPLISIIIDNYHNFAKNFKDIDSQLKSIKNFTPDEFDSNFRIIISCILTILDIENNLNHLHGHINFIDLLCVTPLILSSAYTKSLPSSLSPKILALSF